MIKYIIGLLFILNINLSFSQLDSIPKKLELEFGAGGFAIGFQTDLMDTFPFGQLIVQDRDRPALRLFFGTTLLTTNKHTTDIKLGFSKFNAKFNYETTDSWGMPQQHNWKYYNTTLDFLTISTRISENLNAYKSKFFVKFDIDFNFIIWSKLSEHINSKNLLEISDGNKPIFYSQKYIGVGISFIRKWKNFSLGLVHNRGLTSIISLRNYMRYPIGLTGFHLGFEFN